MLTQDNHKHRPQVRVGLERRQCCIRWDQKGIEYIELLKPSEKVNTIRYRLQMINLNHALTEMWPEWARRQEKSDSNARQLSIKRNESGQRHHFYICLGTLAPPAVLTTLILFWLLPLVFIDFLRTLNETLQQLQICRKMSWWMDHFKKCKVFPWRHHNLPDRWTKCVASDGAYFE